MVQPTASRSLVLLAAAALAISSLTAQGTRADYERAEKLREATRGTVTRSAVEPRWIEGGPRFWYRVEPTASTHTFILVDAETGHLGAAVDHGRVAAELARQTARRGSAEAQPIPAISFSAQTRRAHSAAECRRGP